MTDPNMFSRKMKFWKFVEEIKKEVSGWPSWKRNNPHSRVALERNRAIITDEPLDATGFNDAVKAGLNGSTNNGKKK